MEKKELLDFLITKKYDDIRNFTEFFEDLDNDLIQIKDLSDLEKCVRFIENLKEKASKRDNTKLIDIFIILIDEISKKINLSLILNNIKTKLTNIIESYNESLNDDERTNKIIENYL